MQTKKSISMEDIRPVLTDIVDRARLNGEETIITKNGKPCAKVVGLTEKEKEDFKAASVAESPASQSRQSCPG